jgi:hypothetical protein
MKYFITINLLLLAVGALAQTPINKSVTLQAGQTIEMHFDYPELIKVSTWDKNEVSIQGMVSINDGENDDAFQLETSTIGKTISINASIHNLSELPQRMTIKRNGQKIMFKSKADYKKYAGENGKDYSTMSWGVDMDIILEIKVPKNTPTRIESVYGIVEIKEFNGPLVVEATYGGVDAVVQEKTTGELVAETNYGQIYTDLSLPFDKQNLREENFHIYVSARPGTGPSYSYESKYGNVYLRKGK